MIPGNDDHRPLLRDIRSTAVAASTIIPDRRDSAPLDLRNLPNPRAPGQELAEPIGAVAGAPLHTAALEDPRAVVQTNSLYLSETPLPARYAVDQ